MKKSIKKYKRITKLKTEVMNKNHSSSLFDPSNKKKRLWRLKNPKTLEVNCNLPGSTEKPQTDELRPRLFFIWKNELCYKKKQSSSQRWKWVCMDLTWTRAEFIDTQEPVFSDEFKITLFLVKNQKMTKIFLRNEEEKSVWRTALRDICVMTDFHQKYKGVGILGEGGSAKVKIIIN